MNLVNFTTPPTSYLHSTRLSNHSDYHIAFLCYQVTQAPVKYTLDHMTLLYDQVHGSCQETVLIPTPQYSLNFFTFSS